MTPLRHVMILASAGSGKTYALTNRFVQLLAAGAAPERIVALTFTRKAAGEFFDEILHKLARASRDEAFARRLADDIGQPQLGSRDFLALLRTMVDTMHRLRLGTLDSFFARIARAFPLELGLAGEFEILQEHSARLERQRVLRGMFARTGGALDAAQAEFIEAFKRATFGAEEKQLGARLDAFLDQHQESFLAAPDPTRWGEAAAIWPAGSRWPADEIKLADEIRALRGTLGAVTDGQRARWEAFFAALEQWTPGAPLPPAVEYIVKNALAVWRELCDGCAEMTVERRKLALPREACRALERLITHIVGAELKRRLQTTRGIFAVLRGYEARYHDAVRRAGRLTFADVQRLLAPVTLARAAAAPAGNEGEGRGASDAMRGASARGEGQSEEGDQLEMALFPPDDTGHRPLALATPAESDDRRLLLDYRLDAQIDHWLLDEFQDTSFGQWSILRNLIDEVVQDPEARRSFFCVGDVKQAIYTWREGDPRLFREIFEHYNAASAGAIEERHLVESWRSGPALIDLVNAVFGNAAVLRELFPGPASDAWNREWRAHRSAVPQRNGQAALLHGADEAERWAIVRRLLEEIRPLERGLTCAVLVKKNDTAAALADFLRRAAIPAIAESDLHIATDNPLGAALLALVQAAAHPGDTLAQEHVRMTPLGAALEREGIVTPEALTRTLLQQIHADGFERTVEAWLAELEPALSPDDAFSRQRGRELAAAAGVFDATGSRDIGEFIAFMERHTIRPPESAAVVRVMTIHKSKGLGFDVVILPDLQGNRIDERREGLAVQKGPDRAVEWILDLPPKLFCAQDEVLSAHLRAAEAEACYENMSLLYVALTRAKRAMYVVTEPVGGSTSRNFPRWLAATLGDEATDVRVGDAAFGGVWSSGDPDWHRAIDAAARALAADRGVAIEPLREAAPGLRRHIRQRPSQSGEHKVGAAALFAVDAGAAAEFGSGLHALLAEVEWESDAAERIAAWRGRSEGAATVISNDVAGLGEPGKAPGSATLATVDPGTMDSERRARDVVEAAAACLTAPELAAVWRRPSGRTEVWRERSFEIVLDDAWITGVVDRVVVARDAAGAVVAATVYDFKTDQVDEATDLEARARRYASQLNVYRRVVAVLAGVPVERVEAEIVFTHARRRVRVAP